MALAWSFGSKMKSILSVEQIPTVSMKLVPVLIGARLKRE
jgi:hypothetical protein